MDPQNNQTNQTVNQMPPTQSSPVVPVSGGGGSNKNLIILIVVGVIVLFVLAGALFFYMFQSSPKSSETTSIPVAEVTQEPEVAQTENVATEVKGTSDLDQLITELAQSDSTLEKELSSLEKDSNF